MASQFYGLNIAYTGLIASNAALNTTSNNISNEQTKGYSRQQVNQSAADPLRTYTSFGCSGSGVDVNSVERVRDSFYDFKYWDNQANVGEFESLHYYMKQIEDLFRDDSTTEGFNTIFDKMYANLDELMKQGGTNAAREQFISSAQSLTYYFNSMAVTLESMQLEINTQINNKVDMINSYASEIASLSKQINVVELTGQKANELRDQRDLIIDQLSLIVDVDVQELPITDANNADRETGANRYIVRIAGGQTLVDADRASQLECVSRQNYEKVNQSDALGLYDIYFTDGREFNVYSNTISGELRGLIEMREGNNGENFRGTVTELGQENVDGAAHTTVTIEPSSELFKDFNCCTLPETGGVIGLGSEEYYFDSFKANFDTDGSVKSYTFVLSRDLDKNYRQPTENRIGKDASVGPNVDYQGIPYYQEQLTEWAR
ncbi:MAG: flagellar hook-associated protein FlgK, partial [Lachnospiraceae bacterium]|nr:flagellar hook-associated protein FlgK [Lachnospiraceae bacterium]